jgi:RNA polymerase sigma factor (sigma-70 family)
MTDKNATAAFGSHIRTLFSVGAMGALTDGALLDHFARGGEPAEPAFATLVERYGPMVLRVCRNLLADAHQAEDAFQVTFLLLARRSGAIHKPEELAGWLHRVARRVALRARAQTDRRKETEMPQAAEIAVVAGDSVERDELRAIIHQEIDRLDNTQRLPIVLSALEGLSHEEAAQRLRWPLGTVKSRLLRGRRRLEERLMRRGLAPAIALAVASATDAATAVPLALAMATTRIAVAGHQASNAAAMSATAASLLKDELSAMVIAKLTIVSGANLAASAAVVLIGVALARHAQGIEPQATKAKVPVAKSPITTQAKNNGSKSLPAPTSLTASGRVVDADGTPLAGANVFIREWALQRVRGMPAKEIERLQRGAEIQDILAQTATDEQGGFHFAGVLAPAFTFSGAEELGKTVFPWDIVALAPRHGVAWRQLTPGNQRTAVTLSLPAEGTLRGRLVEPGGKPIAGARVRVYGIDRLGHVDPRGIETDDRLNLSSSSIPLIATTGADGRFAFGGFPATSWPHCKSPSLATSSSSSTPRRPANHCRKSRSQPTFKIRR